ncbi:transposase [Plakobranchus ocellatus]|uniref:Transposase n=1 Tax=Plakobranchus ocellatus TaxID=259542 RepID=A0AAV4BJ78_9GAST|nr:transposase [Plakobranchus ocellatus]
MRNYKRQTDRGQFSRQQMQDAVTAVLAGGSLRKTAARFDVNYKTLERYVKLQKNEGNTDSASFGYQTEKKCVFTNEQEKLLLNYVLEASSIYYGLTVLDLRKLAFDFADANKIPMPHSWESNKIAGEEWMVKFRERHEEELSLRKPEATLLNRMQGFNKTNVNEFIMNLQHAMDDKKFTPDRI